MRRCAQLAPIAIILALQSACSYNLHGPTTLAFTGLTETDAKAVGETLSQSSVDYKVERKGDTTYFHMSGINTTDRLGQVYQDMSDLRTRRHIEFEFEGLTLGYSSLTARGSVTTNIEVEISPGALAFVADGLKSSPWRQIRLDSRGKWSGPVRTSGRISQSGGWLFVAFTRDTKLYRFLRVNVLTGEQESSTLAQAKSTGLAQPSSSRTAFDDGAGTPSGDRAEKPKKKPALAFKWPWQ